MPKIVLEIRNCGDCPQHQNRNGPSQTSSDVWCRLLNRKISGYVEWQRDHNPVPDDCPLLLTNLHRLEAANVRKT